MKYKMNPIFRWYRITQKNNHETKKAVHIVSNVKSFAKSCPKIS